MTKSKQNDKRIERPHETEIKEANPLNTTGPLENAYSNNTILSQIVSLGDYFDNKINESIKPLKTELKEIKDSNHNQEIILTELKTELKAGLQSNKHIFNETVNGLKDKFTTLYWILGLFLTTIIICTINNTIQLSPLSKKIDNVESNIQRLTNDVSSLKEERKLNSYKINQLENRSKNK